MALAADGRAVHRVYWQLFAAALAGAALPWLGLLLLTALQAGAAQGGWLLQAGVLFCWAVIVVQWSLVLMLLAIGFKAKCADGPVERP